MDRQHVRSGGAGHRHGDGSPALLPPGRGDVPGHGPGGLRSQLYDRLRLSDPSDQVTEMTEDIVSLRMPVARLTMDTVTD